MKTTRQSVVRFTTVATFFCMLTAAAVPASGGIVYWAESGHWYEAVATGGFIEWTDARQAAEQRGGYLVSITSAEENAFVYDLILDDEFWMGRDLWRGPWIGAYDQNTISGDPVRAWAWVSGEPWSYTNWSLMEPNSPDEEYVCFFYDYQTKPSTWNDEGKVDVVGAYIVEYSNSPNGPLVWDQEGPGNWGQPRWIGSDSVPDERFDAEVKTDVVTVDSAASALTLTVTSGQLVVASTGDLTVIRDIILAADGTVDLFGALAARSLTNAGNFQVGSAATLSIAEDMTVAAGADVDLSGSLAARSLANAGNVQIADTGNLSVAEGMTVAADAMLGLDGTLAAQSLIHDGNLQIRSTGHLTVAEGMTVAADATLDLAGTLAAGSFATAGTHAIAPGAQLVVTDALTVDSALDMTSATLTTTRQSTDILVNEGGSLTLDQTLRGATLSITGSVLTVGLDVTTLNVSGNGLLSTSADSTATNTIVSGGTLRLTGGANLLVKTMKIGPGEGDIAATVDTGTGSVEISGTLKIGDDVGLGIVGGTFRASGSNLADPAQTRTITLSGGLLTLTGGAILPSGAIANWRLDEGSGPLAADSSTAGNDHAGMIAGATWAEDPQHGTVLSFDGVDDALWASNTSDLELALPVTVAMWINTSVKGGKLLGQDDASWSWSLGEEVLCIDPTSGAVKLVGSSGGTLAGTTNVADGQWHHVAVTYNRSTSPGGQEVYIDGVQDTASRSYFGVIGMGSYVRFGMADYDKGQSYTGLMDDVYVYNRSLTAAEVADLYAAPSSGSSDLPNTDFSVTADSAMYVQSVQDFVALGDLSVASGVTATFSGAALRFQNLSGGNLASVVGNVTVAGALSPGDSPGTLGIVGSLTLDAGSVYVWELGESAADLIAVDGDLTLDDGWTLRLTDAGGLCDAGQQFDLFTCTGLLSLGQGTIDASAVECSGDWDWSAAAIAQDGARVYLTGLTVVPEPSSLVLLLAGGLAGLALTRRRLLAGR